MRMLVIGDLLSSLEKLNKFVDKAAKEKFDLIVFAGNVTDSFSNPLDLDQVDTADLLLQKLLLLKKPMLCVPGNHDQYEILDVFEDYDINLHEKVREFGGVKFIGFGGAETPFNTIFEPTEEETKIGLDGLKKQVEKGGFVLVVHNPPKGTKADKLHSGEHVGSKVIRDFILEQKPILVLTSHIHEALGEDRLGDSVLFNPGPLFDGKYGIIELDGKKVKCELKSL